MTSTHLLLAVMLAAGPDAIVVPNRSIDGVTLGASVSELVGFTVSDTHRWERGPLTAFVSGDRVDGLLRTLSNGDTLTVIDGSNVRRAIAGNVFKLAEQVGTCGAIEVAEGGSAIPCAGLQLEMAGPRLQMLVRVGAGAKAPKVVCTRYAEAPERAWTVGLGDRVCYGDAVFTSETTVDQARTAIHSASEVVPDPIGERLRAQSLHLLFTNKRLVRVELNPPEPAAAAPAGHQELPPPAPWGGCDASRIDDCRSRCARNDLQSCATLGGLLAPSAEAIPFMKRACEGHVAMACFNLGLSYERGHGIKKDFVLARQAHLTGCQLGDAKACGNLGYLLRKGLGGAEEKNRAAALFEQSCQMGNGLACTALAGMRADGEGLPKDPNRAIGFYLRGCDLGQGAGCDNVGVMLMHGDGVPVDNARAFKLFQRACEMDYGNACANAGSFLQSGKQGIEKDSHRAKQAFEKACRLGNAGGCTWVGIMMSAGDGVPKDVPGALRFLERGCHLGDSQGCDMLKKR
ncbi:MAG TPA: tetratricopeptide repeat protein [Myxococcales bacterium]